MIFSERLKEEREKEIGRKMIWLKNSCEQAICFEMGDGKELSEH